MGLSTVAISSIVFIKWDVEFYNVYLEFILYTSTFAIALDQKNMLILSN